MSAGWKSLKILWEVSADIDLNQPGIYEWRIEGAGSYVGKSKRLKRRLREYSNNVHKLALGLPYRAGKPTLLRHIHREMLNAHLDGRGVILSIIENCPAHRMSKREQFWIRQRGSLNR